MTSDCRHFRPIPALIAIRALTALGLGTLILVSAMPRKAEGRDFPAIIQEENISFTVTGNKAEKTVHRKIQVLSQAGRGYGGIDLKDSHFSDIVRFEGKVYGPDGRLRRTYGKKDGEKICGFSGYDLYSDDCILSISLTNDAYPYVIDYTYTIKYASLFFWPEYRPQWDIPVISSIYTLTTPLDFGFRTLVIGNIPPPDTTRTVKAIVYTYRMADVAAYEEEAYAYAPGDVTAGVLFTPTAYTLGDYAFRGESWPLLGMDGFQLFRRALTVDEAQKHFVDSVRTGMETLRELCRHLHRALMRRMRYVAVEIGIGGWQPHPAPQSFALSYGDCKDLTILETSLLTYANIEAHPTLIAVHTDETISEDFPSLMGFNHVILFCLVDGDTIWIDPTCSYCDAGDLPAGDEDQYVLLVDSAAGKLIRTPVSRPEDNVISRTAEVRVNSDRSLSVRLLLSGTGNFREAFLNWLDAIDRRELNQMVNLFSPSDNFIIDSSECVVCEPDSSRITLAGVGHVANAVLSSGNRQYVDVDFLAPLRGREKVKLDDRKLAIDLSYPFTLVDTFVVSAPAGLTVENSPDTVYEDGFGSLRQQVWTADGKICLVRERKSYAYRISPDQIGSFGQYRDELSRRIVHRLALTKP